MSYHLRPVEASPSPTSPTSAASPTEGRQSKPSGMIPAAARSRRPLSPSNLRDVDLTHVPDTAPRKYPAPPTGHDLMAMFPPRPPSVLPAKPEPTSRYFQGQERSFFAQPGKEIVRVHVEVDLPSHRGPDDSVKSRAHRDSRGWPPSHSPSSSVISVPPSQNHSPALQRASPPGAGATHHSYPNRRAGPPGPPSSFPQMPPLPGPQPSGTRRSPPFESPSSRPEFQGDELREDSDEAWRTPMPYAERRRAGKHTRRVVVRN
ncbi:hypothetical protein C8J56DRAFT_980389 [Mycena floridula]|nr:hypothetical protein C8J56DRAFT_980389 [Mycena floridula]